MERAPILNPEFADKKIIEKLEEALLYFKFSGRDDCREYQVLLEMRDLLKEYADR